MTSRQRKALRIPEEVAREDTSYPAEYRAEGALVRACLAGLTGRMYLLNLGYLETATYRQKKAAGMFLSVALVARQDYIDNRLRLLSDEEWIGGAVGRGNQLGWQDEAGV